MAVTREEISIKIGVDSKAAISTLERLQMRVKKFANDAKRSFDNFLKGGVIGAGAALTSMLYKEMEQFLPWTQKFWDAVYGVNAETSQKLEQSADNLRRLRKETEAAAKALEDAQYKSLYDHSTNAEKLQMLQQRKNVNDTDITSLTDQESRLKGTGRTEELAKVRAEILRKKLQGLNLDKEISDISGKISPDQAAQIFGQMLSDSVGQVPGIRAEIAKQSALGKAANRYGLTETAAEASAAEKAARMELGKILAARAINTLGSVAGLLPNTSFGGMDMLRESLLTAQQAAIENTIQRVSIVEIKAK